jgi:hypothetical protein
VKDESEAEAEYLKESEEKINQKLDSRNQKLDI